MSARKVQNLALSLKKNIGQVIKGKDEALEKAVICFLA